MSDVAIIAEPVAEAEPATNEADAAAVEAIAEASTDVAETHADAAVDIARIEADRDVELARINAASAETQTEALADAITDTTQQELEQCRTRIANLEMENSRLTGELSTLQASLTSPPNQSEQQADAAAGVTPDSQEEVVAAEPAKPKRPFHRWI